MLTNFIQKLREKPKHTRDNIALWFAGGFTAIVFAVWLVAFFNEPRDVVENSKDGVQAFSTFFDQIKNDYNEMRKDLPSKEEIEKMIASSTEESEFSSDITISTSSPEMNVEENNRQIVRIATTSPEENASSTDATDSE